MHRLEDAARTRGASRSAESPAAADPVREAVTRLRRPGELLRYVQRAWEHDGFLHADGARVQQTHYKPFSRARLVVEVTGRRTDVETHAVRQYLFVQVYPSAEEAIRRFEATDRKHALKCIGPPLFVIPELSAIAWSLPNSPRLRTAKIGFRPKKFLRRRKLRLYLLRRGLDPLTLPRRPDPPDLVRLVPRRRALFRYEVPGAARPTTLFIKVYGPGLGRIARDNLRLVAAASRRGELGFRVPKAVTYSPRRRALVMKGLAGVPLSETATSGSGPALHAVGRALAGLHGSDLSPSARWSPDQELRALGDAMHDVRRALPAQAEAIDVVLDRLRERRGRLRFDDAVPIHGNLFGDQILVGGRGIGIVDWDDLCVGDPAYDVGRLLAHLVFLWRRASMDRAAREDRAGALLAGYASAGREVDAARLRWHQAAALLMRAKISALRPLADTWTADVEGCVAEAVELLR